MGEECIWPGEVGGEMRGSPQHPPHVPRTVSVSGSHNHCTNAIQQNEERVSVFYQIKYVVLSLTWGWGPTYAYVVCTETQRQLGQASKGGMGVPILSHSPIRPFIKHLLSASTMRWRGDRNRWDPTRRGGDASLPIPALKFLSTGHTQSSPGIWGMVWISNIFNGYSNILMMLMIIMYTQQR